ncbi:MAG: site-specific DNA-methyltransferase [Methanospirillum sp.]|uniref:DNA methyltransferase n=1 Tax=Methanospirillum sp. TaxID=45200 RepID=UPI0023716F17|nr:DNA methyltransferase [Methanospirillum sp.]MDD1728182.1 site-specific DNA-methyltransferase [Methanospirillum sp.]
MILSLQTKNIPDGTKMNRYMLSLNEAAEWATKYMGKNISPSNIRYLLQYARVKRYTSKTGEIQVEKSELQNYYDIIRKKEQVWREKLGDDLNWNISFDQYRESDTTKHVHRLHPYKGKFIPQLVEYFLDKHTDSWKRTVFFREGDIVLDPFMGSGTTLVQAAELGMHSVGIDISGFNCLVAEVKCDDYRLSSLQVKLDEAYQRTLRFSQENFNDRYDTELKRRISTFNARYFPNPEYKLRVQDDRGYEQAYGNEKIQQFITENQDILPDDNTQEETHLFDNGNMPGFLRTWYNKRIRQELRYYLELIDCEKDVQAQKVMRLILSRTARSCRGTTHYDLATLKDRQSGPYYCYKHLKICTPVGSIRKRLKYYTEDTIHRLSAFAVLKKQVHIGIIHGDSRFVNIFNLISQTDHEFSRLLKEKKISGLFSSPPYVGQIDYHEQHAYAYELFDIERYDPDEIGAKAKGTDQSAKERYINDISDVLINVGQFICDDGFFCIVANDRHRLYPEIADRSMLTIIQEFKRPVLNRTERDRQPYAETIFIMKKTGNAEFEY